MLDYLGGKPQGTMRFLVLFIGFGAAAYSQNSDTLLILYTNNTNGNLVACDCGDHPQGGLAKRKALMDRSRKEFRVTLTVDAGDILEPFGFRRAQDSVTLSLYRYLGYDAVNIGDNEFAHGIEFFRERVLRSDIPWVSATIMNLDNDPVVVPSRVVERSGVRIGIVGYTPRSSFENVTASKWASIRIEEERRVLRRSLDDLGRADVTIVLSQAGDEGDLELARLFPDVNVIVGSHTQVEIEDPLLVGKTIVVQAGGNGTHVGRLRLVQRNGDWNLLDNQLIPLESNLPEDETVRRIVDEFLKP